MADLISTFPPDNINAVLAALNKYGITNHYLQAAILAVIGKESGFRPKNELSYKHTDSARLQKIFPTALGKLSLQEVDVIKSDDIVFYDKIYGGRYGNTSYGDGYKYRGRGFNQLTFKAQYELIGKEIGVDLVNNPDKMNELQVAADAVAVYYRDRLKGHYNVSDPNAFKDLTEATKIAIQANAGNFTEATFSGFTVQEGYKKALASVDSFYAFVLANPIAGFLLKKKNRIVFFAVVVIIIVVIVVIVIRK